MPSFFDKEVKKKAPSDTQKVRSGSYFQTGGATKVTPTSKEEEPSFLSKAGSFLGNAAKEAVVAPIRGALKYSVGAVAQGVNELTTGNSLQELNVPIIGNIAPLGNKDAEGKRIAPVRYLAEAGETALEIGTAALGGTVVKSLAKGGLKAGVKQAAKVALFDSAVGAAYGATTSLQDPEATPESVATGTALGAGIGLVLPPVAGKTIEAGLKLGGGLIRQGSKAVEKTALGLEKYAGKELINPLEKIGVDTTKVKGLFDSVSPEVSDQTFMQKIAETTAKGIRELQKAPERVAVGFNRLRKVSQLQETEAVRENMAKLGIDADLADKQQRVNNVALFKGQEYQKNYVDSVYKPMENEAERYYLSTYIQHLDAMDNVAKGKQVAGGYSPEEATKRFYEFRDSMKELGILEKLKAQQAKHVEFWDKILRDGVDSGRISEESYANIKKDHPNYMPNFKINEDGELISETGEALGATSAEKLKFKSRKGSTRENLDPVEATLTKIMNETYKNEKAKADKVFFDSIKGIEEKVGIKKISPEEPIKAIDIPKDMVKVSRLNQGVTEEYLMPKYLGRAISGLGSDQIEGWMRVLTGTALGRALIAPTKALRSVATTFNPGFVLANYMRDIQTAGMMANPSSPLKLSAAKYIVGDIIDGFKNALFRNNPEKNELYRQAGAKGLFFDSFFDADTTEGIYKSILGKKKILGATMDPKTLSPLKAIGEAGRILEQTTRLAVFRNSLRRGLTPEQAVKEAANATVDFGKRGDISTLLNQVIPFFNAGAQGTINLANTIAKNPTEFSRRAFYMGAIPTAMTYAHNRGYESYKNIPDWEKHMYWIVMVSEMPGKNYRGEDIMIPNYIKIPKGIPQQLISTPIESFFKQIDGQEPETLSQLLRFIGSRTSPISFDEGLGGGGFGDLAKAVGSSAMPLIVKYPAELMTNYSFFKGKAIVPDYVYKKEKDKWMKSEELPPEERFSSGSESAAGKMIGEVLGLSPLQIDYMIKTGGLKDLVWTLDLGLKTEADRSAKKDMLRRDLTPVETLSEIPVLRTFFGSSAYGQEQKQREKEKLEAQSTNKRLLEYLRSE